MKWYTADIFWVLYRMDSLYDFYNPMESAKEIWNSLEYKYKTKNEGTDKFLNYKYLEFSMVDTKSVLAQIHALQVLVTKLCELKVEISESFQVGAIIAKLPQSWNDYKKRLLHRRDDMLLEDLHKHPRIEEETRSRDPRRHNSNVNVAEGSKNNKDKGKGKGKRVLKANNDGKFKKKFPKKYFNYGKNGHKASECKNK